MEDRTVATILEKYMALGPLLDERAKRYGRRLRRGRWVVAACPG